MEAYDAMLLALFSGTLVCFWRAWRSGELREVKATIQRCVEHGVHLAR